MLVRIWCVLLLLFWGRVSAQLILDENFSTGNWNSPNWAADTQLLRIVNGRLQLRDSQAGRTVFSHPLAVGSPGEWQLHGEIQFNPSSSNFLQWFVMADHAKMDSVGFAYFLRLGGNSDDQIEFYRRDASQDTLLISSPLNYLNLGTNQFHLRLSRSSKGYWELWADTGVFHNWMPLGSAEDSAHQYCSNTILACYYTRTRSDKFFFDSLRVSGAPHMDSLPPRLSSHYFENDSSLVLNFKEKLKKPNSLLFEGSVRPFVKKYNWDWRQPKQLEIRLRQNLPKNQPLGLSISGLRDLFGNSYLDTLSFLRRRVLLGELLITEVMADPSPKVDPSPLSFPEVEYLEIYNASELEIPLAEQEFFIGEKSYVLPDKILKPKSYLILSATSTLSFWPRNRPVFGMDWSAATLANTEAEITFRNNKGDLIEYLNYSEQWHQDDKAFGGWSIERIDLDCPCGDEFNWSSSMDLSGGSPGRENSVKGSYPDSVGPRFLAWYMPGPETLKLEFNKSIAFDSIHWLSYPELSWDSLSIAGNFLSFHLNRAFDSNQTYWWYSFDSIYDCAGNAWWFDSLAVGVASQARAGQIRFSELLFNPLEGGVDFIEIKNLGKAFCDVASFRVATWDSETGLRISLENLQAPHRIMAPGEVLALTKAKAGLHDFYEMREENVLENINLPSMPDQGCALQLERYDGLVLDRVQVAEDYHNYYIANPEGVSLYRINYQKNALHSADWQSSPKNINYASPGWLHESRYTKGHDGALSIHPEYLSPNGDGFKDYITIHYLLNQEAFIHLSIYDRSGRWILDLEPGAWLSPKGEYFWDGELNSGVLAPAGIYFAYLEYRLRNGREGRERCSFVLSR